MENFVNIEDFGAIGDASKDDAASINAAIQNLVSRRGGILYIPAKTYAIGSELIIDYPGIIIRSASPYFSGIKLKSTFEGEAAIVFKPSSRVKPDDYKLTQGVGIENGLLIDCNNQEGHGITGIRLYDQVSMRNVQIKNVHKDCSGFNFVQEKDGYSQLGQTILLENCFAERAKGEAITPMYYFERYQEVNLVGCKSFSSSANATNPTELQGDAFYLKDCKGFTFTGCSAAFSENAIVVEADGKYVSGITILGQTNEAIASYAVKTKASNTTMVESITVLPIRNEIRKMKEKQPDGSEREVVVGGGNFDIQNTTKALIYSMDAALTLGTNSSQNVVFSTASNKVINLAGGNSIFGLANFAKPGTSILDALTINEFSSVPTVYFADKADANKSRIEQQSTNLRFGFRYVEPSGAKSYINKFIILKNDLVNATNIQVTYPEGTNTVVRRVEIGEPNSAGEGYRGLRIRN
ncbi:hypothetical protein HCA55_07310 [Listeria booriae]|uniref:Rhamnogalacturonase A/B/Epimerase-like pectate lyase domain-containing protein n=1 Tax=Listeria booriae TaxID=1552123 RepID=A0A842B2M9_9LIST|nr:glycosyl hydrolase family 28-related protein [Listeria booriae]MBC1796528.1 hypothetical protein [Listeria booriae]